MSRETAERWVIISAVVTIGIYAYRRLAGPAPAAGNVRNIVSTQPPPPLGQFATAWGFMYLVIAVMAEASPGLGGGFAILVMTADVLANTGTLISQVAKQEGAAVTTTPAKTTAGSSSGQTLDALSPLDPIQPLSTG